MSESLALLHEQGQSTWLDFISRGFLDSGALQRLIDDAWISGLTSNPTIFGKAIAGSSDYDDELRALADAGVSDPYDAFVRLAGADLRRAADALRPIYEAGGGEDGYVSFELPPGVEHDSQRSIAEARRLVEAVGRPNVMIKVPGTPNAPETVERLIGEGVNVNITLLFDIAVYEGVARAYVAGLERALEAGRDLSAIASVASFFVSRVDTQVDGRLPDDSPLRGRAGVANARAAYARFAEVFSGATWDGLSAAGARVQRPLWASTGTKNAAYSDVLYVDNLVAPHTVNTLPEPTLNAFAEHGDASHAITRDDEAEAEAALAALADADVDLKAVTDQLLLDGLDAFEADFLALLRCIDEALTAIRSGSARSEGRLGPIEAAAGEALDRLAREDVAGRLQAGDHTLWADDPAGVSNRLGWLTAPDDFAGRVEEIEAFARRGRRRRHRRCGAARDGRFQPRGGGDRERARQCVRLPGAQRPRHDRPGGGPRPRRESRPLAHALRGRQQVGDDGGDTLAARLLLGAPAGRYALRGDHGPGHAACRTRRGTRLPARLPEPAGDRRALLGAVLLRPRARRAAGCGPAGPARARGRDAAFLRRLRAARRQPRRAAGRSARRGGSGRPRQAHARPAAAAARRPRELDRAADRGVHR